MYLINTDDEHSLHSLAEDIDAIDEFDHVDLAELNSLSLMEATDNAASDWMRGEPVVFNEENGVAIGRFSVEGVRWLRDFGQRLLEFGADPVLVAEFASRCKEGHVYFLDAF